MTDKDRFLVAFKTALSLVDEKVSTANQDGLLHFLKSRGEKALHDFESGEVKISKYSSTCEEIQIIASNYAITLYKQQFWDLHHYGELPQKIGVKIFVLATNVGANTAHGFAQRACNALGASLAVDYILGPKTRAAIAAADETALREAICRVAIDFYAKSVIHQNSFLPYIVGWMRRAQA